MERRIIIESKIYYHYFSGITKDGCNYSLNSLKEGKVTFSHINYFNDPCEIAIVPDKYIGDKPSSDIRYQYETLFRVFCFSKNFNNPIMWGHYGNSHKGFCAGYDEKDILNIPEHKNELCFCSVNYVDKIPPLSDQEILKGQALYYKSFDWKNEQEWRASIRLHCDERDVISELEFLAARKEWIQKKIFFEKAVDSHLRLPAPITPTSKEAREKVSNIRKEIVNFELEKYAYSVIGKGETGQNIYGKFPMRIEVPLKAKVIYVGLRTPDDLRKSLKKYAKENGIEIYEMAMEESEYSFIAKKIMI